MDNYKTWSKMKNIKDVEAFFKLGAIKKDRVEMQNIFYPKEMIWG